ncbi:BamA/TamA family outer membrane protein [Olivibacter ginsenosidimutans]|uniref:BamA/TamA family outer membrane protein n=1 Tax=Olivibacter ginsenosidimutans TaxID=1176537 RepID=A0ABP9APD3_9SPHI
MKVEISRLYIGIFLLVISYGKAMGQEERPGLYKRFMNGKLMQSKLVQKFISTEKDSSRSAGFVVLPLLGYAPETGLEYGLSGIYNFYLDKQDTLIRTSSLVLQGSFTTKHQTNLKFTSDIWTRGNNFHFLSELRYKDFPFNFYGLGKDTWKADKDSLTQRLFRFKWEGEKKIVPHYYAGIGVLYEHHRYRDEAIGGIYDRIPLYGRNGGKYLSFGISQAYDTRNSNLYTTKGYFARLVVHYTPDFWGKENFHGTNAEIDLRAFYPLTEKLTLGLQATYSEYFGDTPFYLLPQLGSDETMRGYYPGRYRDKLLVTSQAELRYRIHPRIGFAAFAGGGSVYHQKFDFSSLKPSYGGGLRYFFDLEHNSSVRIDYGVGEKRPGEPRQTAFYLSLGEAF